MSKLYPARVIIAALKRAGFTVVSQRGSHMKLTKENNGKISTVIVPDHKEIAMGTFQSILKQAGMTKKELERFI